MLPTGYLEMDRADYAARSLETQREIFRELREIVRYSAGHDIADGVIRAQLPVAGVMPVDWIMAVKAVTIKCERCNGSGTYSWGACINGRMTHSAPCARCGGKGWMDFDDMRRSRAYDNYAIVRACRS